MEKILITIILVNIDIRIIQTIIIIFDFDNMKTFIQHFPLKKIPCNWELWNFPLKKKKLKYKLFKSKIMNKYASSCAKNKLDYISLEIVLNQKFD